MSTLLGIEFAIATGRDPQGLKPSASAQMAWVRSQLSARGLLNASPQRGGSTCLMARFPPLVDPVVRNKHTKHYETSCRITATNLG